MRPKVYLETFGCQMNVADTERAVTSLRESGYEIAHRPESADAIIFNTCSVRARAEQKVYSRIGEVRKAFRKASAKMPVIGVMGCVAQLQGEAIFEAAPDVNIILGTRATDRLPQMLSEVLSSVVDQSRSSSSSNNFKTRQRLIDLGERDEGEEEWNVSSVARRSPFTAFVPIIEGCNKFCSFCIVPYSRGRERSRSPLSVVEEVCKLRDEGYREVHLIGQNVNSYRAKSDSYLAQFEGATDFCKLLRAVAATNIDRIKFTTSFPRDFHTDIVATLEAHENLCNWVHLPVQSGNDRVLKAMRRGYKVCDYLAKVHAIKSSARQIALTTDIIIGFPGETEEEFEDTLKILRACEFDGVYFFKYSARQGTPAASLEGVLSLAEMNRRFQAADQQQLQIQQRLYAAYVGQEVEVLVEGASAKSLSDMTGHTGCNKVINFAGSQDLIGSLMRVKVTEAKTHSLTGHLV